jgi:hypothetical protein
MFPAIAMAARRIKFPVAVRSSVISANTGRLPATGHIALPTRCIAHFPFGNCGEWCQF